jgi:hypothetical protein
MAQMIRLSLKLTIKAWMGRHSNSMFTPGVEHPRLSHLLLKSFATSELTAGSIFLRTSKAKQVENQLIQILGLRKRIS